jgi:ubiquinone/menaquinone biosynthesis C-methylase UbiE
MSDDPAKKAVYEYWQNKPCGTEFGKDEDLRKYFLEIEEHRYRVEPFIHSFAQFTRWRGKKVLEVGVGAGTDHLQFARAGAILTGVDLTAAAVGLTEKRFVLEGLTSRVQQGDAEGLPFEAESFDFVYSWGVMHHTPDTAKAVDEIYRVCRKGGRICVMLYHRYSMLVFALYVYHGLLKGRPFRTFSDILADHLESKGTKAYSVSDARKMFEKFRNVSITPILTPYDKNAVRPEMIRKIFSPLLNNLPSRMGFFMVIEGEK